jgi:hypothetical protein
LTLSSHNIRKRNHAAKVLLFADIVLDHHGFADHLDVDRQASTVVRRRCTGRDVIGRAAA